MTPQHSSKIRVFILVTLLTLVQARADTSNCASIRDASWHGGQTQTQRDYSRTDLSCATFNDVTFFIKTRFDSVQFANGAMRNSTCVFCSFRGAKMSGSNLSGSTFDGATMAGADFSARDREAQADLSAARLVSVDFSAANLSKANLSKADLSSSNLKGARFNEANLTGTRLSSAVNTESAIFVGAIYDEHTEFPTSWTCTQIAERGLRFQPTDAAAVLPCDPLDATAREALRDAIARRTAAINQLRQPATAPRILKN